MASATFRFKFDPNLDYQLAAIDSVVRVFEGLPRVDTQESILSADVVPNLPPHMKLYPNWLFENVLGVQQNNSIESNQQQLDVDDGLMLENISVDSWQYPSFTVEMETGTGKTYVYLRTIHELFREYGFRKFIIVVPSIAIYSGVVKSFEVIKSHFAALYGNPTINLTRYDSSQLSQLRSFATSTFIEVMVITLASFNRNTGRYPNRIYRPSEQLPGERLPYEFIQETRPILILDEPQNMESPKSKAALRTLRPLFALRYSATHRETPNLLYQLTPFEAYKRNLVKKIEVLGVTERDNLNRDLLVLESIERRGSKLVARVRTNVLRAGQTREESVELFHGDDLYQKTRREEHRHGYVVSNIDLGNGVLEFEGQDPLTTHDVFGAPKREIFRTQIDQTVQCHMQKQEELREQGLKVLSLFFIDRVDNYVQDDGIIRLLFDEAFERHKHKYEHFRDLDAEDVQASYFAKRKKKNSDEEEAWDTSGNTNDERAAEQAAFDLIMRDKEKLLSFGESVSFIFAHSALKEGWDSPNVFQICTLNQTVSEMKKRQEIGRGLRLPVNQEGDRIVDDRVNILTVVANESYEMYAARLQSEYREEGYTEAPPPPSRAERSPAQRRDAHFNDPRFRRFWDKLMRQTRYKIHVDTDEVVQRCVEQLNNVNEARLKPQLVIERGDFVITQFTITLEEVNGKYADIRVDKTTTHDARRPETSIRSYAKGDRLTRALDDQRLRGFQLDEVVDDGAASHVVFTNDVQLYVGQSASFQSESGQIASDRARFAADNSYPVFNLLDRAAKETGLTRPTINRMFKMITPRIKEYIFRNPEGFANIFIATIKDVLADHVAVNLEFVVDGAGKSLDLEELFPESKKFVQEELVDAGPYGVYDRVQVDSDVERRFVERYLSGHDTKVIAYFKFPPAFRIDFPSILGDYNPDWGILRENGEGQRVLELVRETKGQEDVTRLQFSHEKRKIHAARRHFKALGVDYRPVSDETVNWWEPEHHRQEPLELD